MKNLLQQLIWGHEGASERTWKGIFFGVGTGGVSWSKAYLVVMVRGEKKRKPRAPVAETRERGCKRRVCVARRTWLGGVHGVGTHCGSWSQHIVSHESSG